MTRPALIVLMFAFGMVAAPPVGAMGSRPAKPVDSADIPRPVVSEILSDHAARPRPVPGFIAASNEVALAFQTLGRLIARPVELGNIVHKNDILAQLDPEDLDDQVRAAEAAVHAAQTQYDTASIMAERTRRLAERNVTSTAQLEQAENTLAMAEAGLLQAQSDLIGARDQQGFSEITAPFDGVISAVWAEPGEVVQAGTPVVTLSGRHSREAIIDLTESELADVEPGAPWVIWQDMDPDFHIEAKVDRIAALADTRTRTRRVRLSLPPDVPFRLGALIRATRSDDTKEDLTLPATAILQDGYLQTGDLQAGPAQVWVVKRPDNDENGTVSLHDITITPRPDGRVSVSGLPAGTEVVTRGVRSLAEGQIVAQGIAP